MITLSAQNYLFNYIAKNKVDKIRQQAIAQEIASEEVVDLKFVKELLKAEIIKL
jgi:hypothetical protein